MNDYLKGRRTPGPISKFFPAAYQRSIRHPEWIPEGTRDAREVLDEAPPELGDKIPVVLVHGTWMNSYNTYAMIGPALAENRPVYTLDYGAQSEATVARVQAVNGTDALEDSFREIAQVVDELREHIGATRIDIVGHSQGAMHVRHYANTRFDALYDKAIDDGLSTAEAEEYAASHSPVRAVICLAGNHHGTNGGWARWILYPLDRFNIVSRERFAKIFGAAGVQQGLESPYIKKLVNSERGMTRRGLHYLNIASPFDTIVTPWSGAFLPEVDGHDITNINNAEAVGDWSDHLALLFSPNAITQIIDYLDRTDGLKDGGAGSKNSIVTGTPARVLPFLGPVPKGPRLRGRLRGRTQR